MDKKASFSTPFCLRPAQRPWVSFRLLLCCDSKVSSKNRIPHVVHKLNILRIMYVFACYNHFSHHKQQPSFQVYFSCRLHIIFLPKWLEGTTGWKEPVCEKPGLLNQNNLRRYSPYSSLYQPVCPDWADCCGQLSLPGPVLWDRVNGFKITFSSSPRYVCRFNHL